MSVSANTPVGAPPVDFEQGSRRVAVVGGGLAGVTAALDLADAGLAVTLLEARPRLGGATASFRREPRGADTGGPLDVDTGQHVFLRCCTAYRGLLERLGVSADTVLQAELDVPVVVARRGTVRRTRLRRAGSLPPPLHLSSALLRYGALSPVAKLRSVPATLALGRLDPRDPAVDGVSFGAWLRAHGQSADAIDALWSLLTVATLNAHPDDASLALAATVVRTGLLESAGGADIGWAAVPLGRLHGDAGLAALATAAADVEIATRVLAVESVGAGWQLRVAPTRGTERDLEVDVVVLAVPPAAAAALAPAGSGVDPVALDRLGDAPIVNIHVVYDQPVLTEPFLGVVGSPIQWIFDRSGASGRPAGTYIALSQSAADPWIDRPAGDLITEFTAELARLLPAAARATVLDAFVTRERAATFRPAPGQGALRPGTGTSLPGLVLAGAWTDTGWPATMESAVRSGHAAAAHLLRTPRLRKPVAA